jgi:CDP-diacylglycerol--glycerol-3-phosphate 3-phosphatidyltransferase
MIAIIVLLAVDAERDGSEVLALGMLLLYVAAALTIWSMWHYLRGGPGRNDRKGPGLNRG